ncbi:hypothetical protein BC832DRAFT_557562 [Gaertneriomyces semiglobifer]|nr:hypothetical protein BC832DRAFT_557562 [Gaertneriomyces semiglobifer]
MILCESWLTSDFCLDDSPCRSHFGRNTVYRIAGVESLCLDTDLPAVGNPLWRAISADMGANPDDHSHLGSPP